MAECNFRYWIICCTNKIYGEIENCRQLDTINDLNISLFSEKVTQVKKGYIQELVSLDRLRFYIFLVRLCYNQVNQNTWALTYT